jgi:hypothetical protein
VKPGSSSVAPEEKARRQALISRNTKFGPYDQIALITIQDIRLTQRHSCAKAAAQAAISDAFNWRQAEIPASPQIFYQVYGVVGSNGVNDELGGDKNSFLFAAARGEISAEVASTKDRITESRMLNSPKNHAGAGYLSQQSVLIPAGI